MEELIMDKNTIEELARDFRRAQARLLHDLSSQDLEAALDQMQRALKLKGRIKEALSDLDSVVVFQPDLRKFLQDVKTDATTTDRVFKMRSKLLGLNQNVTTEGDELEFDEDWVSSKQFDAI